MCTKILHSDIANMYQGLLSNPPAQIASEMEAVLNECMSLNTGQLDATSKIFERLLLLLKQSENYA